MCLHIQMCPQAWTACPALHLPLSHRCGQSPHRRAVWSKAAPIQLRRGFGRGCSGSADGLGMVTSPLEAQAGAATVRTHPQAQQLELSSDEVDEARFFFWVVCPKL